MEEVRAKERAQHGFSTFHTSTGLLFGAAQVPVPGHGPHETPTSKYEHGAMRSAEGKKLHTVLVLNAVRKLVVC